MTFQPIVPLGGFAGWQFLNRTLETQQEAFNTSSSVTRLTDYFRENIAEVRTAEALVEDRRLREVALGAFGLDDDIDAKFFIQTILEEGTVDDSALANRLTDSRYRALAEAFGFGNPVGARTNLTFFADEIISRYEDKQFQIAVGNQNNDLRLALNLESELSDLLDTVTGEDAQWFSIMGSSPLRTVFQTAVGLPSSVATLDVDKQLEIFKERAEKTFGSDKVADLNTEEAQETMIRLFLIRSEATSAAAVSSGNVALSLLQTIQPLNQAV